MTGVRSMKREKEVMVASHDEEESAEGLKLREELLPCVNVRRGLPTVKRVAPCTPVPAWKLEGDVGEAGPARAWGDSASASASVDANHNGPHSKRHHRRRAAIPFSAAAAGAAVSVRKLGANLWETQDLPRSSMSRRGARARHHREEQLADLSDLSPPGPQEVIRHAGDLKKNIAASVIQHHRSTERNAHALQPFSPASYNSSMEAITPTSSLDLKARPGYGLKTSMELLRVLNRIWSLEEQHASSISLAKTLKLELEHAQARIQELLREKQSGRREIDELMNQIMEDNLVRKSKEQERIKTAVQSIKDELEDERRLRKLSEGLHRKLAKELSEVKSAFLKALKDLDMEKKACNLLENLCDEFAKGVREYEQEVRELKQTREKACDHRCDRLVLHISDAWLDERMQMKLAEAQGDLSEKNTIMDRLTSEVETFLQSRRINSSKDDVLVHDTIKDTCLRRHSLESIHFNGVVSAPQDFEDEDSVASDLQCFELDMGGDTTERHDSLKLNGIQSVEKLEGRKSNATKKMMGSSERFKYQGSSSSQVKLDRHAQSCNGGGTSFMNRMQGIHKCSISKGGKDANHVDVTIPQESEDDESLEGVHGIEVKQDSTHGSNNVIENSVREMEIVPIHNAHPENDHKDGSCDAGSWRHHSLTVGMNNASGDCHSLSCPVQPWNYHHSSPDLEISECSSKLPRGVKENTLKAKLLEARLEGRHARLQASRGSSVGV